jgi:GNAT superfamily N-acetyltransferase
MSRMADSHPCSDPVLAGAGIEVRTETPPLDEALALYAAVGWSAYTEAPEILERALGGSSSVVTARREGRLLGLARVVSDGAVIAYLQDVLVRPEAQGEGIGRRLVEEAFAPFAAVRQQVLLTDAEPGQRAFYESLGFVEVGDHEADLRSFVRLL